MPIDISINISSSSFSSVPEDGDRKGKGRMEAEPWASMDAPELPPLDDSTSVLDRQGEAAQEGIQEGDECPVCGILVPNSLLVMHVNAHFDEERGMRPREPKGLDINSRDHALAQELQAEEANRYPPCCLYYLTHKVGDTTYIFCAGAYVSREFPSHATCCVPAA